ncbi:MAG: ketoacyl-ACP synthase III [Nitrospirae bacterium]|nr:MAG: ketoacyl-ACP synthase III [Nitrospirota bacterium]
MTPTTAAAARPAARTLPQPIHYGQRTGVTARILGCGLNLPPHELDNDALAEWHGLSARERVQLRALTKLSGVRRRYYVEPGTTHTELAEPAALRALEAAGLEPEEVGLLLFCATGQDQAIPHNNTLLQDRIGARNAFSFDVKNICASFATGLHVAAQFIEAHPEVAPVLVVSSEVNSPFLHRGHTHLYNIGVLGDGAAAMVLGATDNVGREGFVAGIHRVDPSGKELIRITGGGSRVLERDGVPADIANYSFWTDPQGLYAKAVETFVPAMLELMEATGWRFEELRWVVPHQAAKHGVFGVAAEAGVPKEKVYATFPFFGNTASASLPMAFAHAVAEGAIERGDRILLACPGAGAVSSAITLIY